MCVTEIEREIEKERESDDIREEFEMIEQKEKKPDC